mmetsp:Transcript_114175/g.160184  ORF Transcript_114175/g.160184 Transcript_114175/m.160184 type:complete len:96 (+) Transcript_114175:8-295(+)
MFGSVAASVRGARVGARMAVPRRAGSSSAPPPGPEPPNGFLFGEPPSGVRSKATFETPMEICFAGMVLFSFAWIVRPDQSPRSWARQVAEKELGK